MVDGDADPTSALQAATRAAAELGVEDCQPRLLADRNTIVVALDPHPFVAKLASDGPSASHLATEAAILRHLDGTDAPVARLADVSSNPVSVDPWTVLLLEAVDVNGADPTNREIAAALVRLHRHLATCKVDVRPYSDGLHLVAELLGDPGRTPWIDEKQRATLKRAHASLTAKLPHDLPHQVVHSDLWDDNVLAGTGGVTFIDFGATRRAPVEWDLTLMPRLIDHYPGADLEAVEVLVEVRHLMRAVWGAAHTAGDAAHIAHTAGLISRLAHH